MLTKLTLLDFQKFKKKVIEFDELCTTLIGPTDAGKSTTIRGLLWIMLNRPTKKPVRFGRKRAHGILEVDGHVIERIQGQRINIYKLDGETYAVPNKGVPEPIAAILNVSDDNVHRQLDGPFWFQKTPGQLSKELNRIVNLEEIDRTLENIGGIHRRARNELNVAKSRLRDAAGRRESLAWVRDAGRTLDKLQALAKSIDERRDRIRKLDEIMFQIMDREFAQNAAERESETLAGIIAAGNALRERTQQLARLSSIIKQLSKPKRKIPAIAPLQRIVDSIVEKQSRLDRLTQLIRDIERENERWHENNARAVRLRKSLTKSANGRCPLCGQKVRPQQLLSPTSTCGTRHR